MACLGQQADICGEDGLRYTGVLGWFTFEFSPWGWDIKIVEWDPCPEEAPDCNFGIKVGPFGMYVGCQGEDD